MKNITKLFVLGFGASLLGSSLLASAPISTLASDFSSKGTHETLFKKVDTTTDSAVLLSQDGKKLFGTGKGGMNGVSATNLTEATLVNIPLSANETIVDIDAGESNVLVATSEGDVYTYGLGQAPYNTAGSATPVDITANVNATKKAIDYVRQGRDTAFIIFEDGTIVGWGSNNVGQLGANTTADAVVRNLTTIPTAFKGVNTIRDFDVRYQSGYAILSNGDLYTWGLNTSGQLGLGNTTNRIAPVRVSITNVYSATIGFGHALALTGSGINFNIFAWGVNNKRQLTNQISNIVLTQSPNNITTYFTQTGKTENDGYVDNNNSLLGDFADGNYEPNNNYYARPVSVLATNDSSYMVVEGVYIDNGTHTPDYHSIIGFGNNENGQINYWDDLGIMGYPEYLDTDYYDEEFFVESFGINGHFSGIVNTEGDFLLQGINLNNRLGVADAEENYVINYSYNVRDFINYTYDYLPVNFEAPLEDEYDTLAYDVLGTIFGYWPNDFRFEPGIVSYYFDTTFSFLSERERTLITEAQWTRMREIFAEVFEDEVLYGWIGTDAELEAEMSELDIEDRSWYREDIEFYTEYGSYNLSDYLDDYIYLDDETIALLDASVETRLDEFRVMLDHLNTFEQDFLQTFIDAVFALEATSENSFTYTDEDQNRWLELGQDEIAELIELGYGDDILAIFDAYDELTTLEQLLITEYYYWNYDELYYEYYQYFADVYSDALFEFEFDVQEEEWGWIWPLWANLSELETLLASIGDLNPISASFFTESYDMNGETYYSYSAYEYWIYLNDLLPLLQESKDVWAMVDNIETNIIQYNSDEDFNYVDIEDAQTVIDMYEAFLLLSEEAQNLLDPEYIYWIYSLALEAQAYAVEEQLWDLWDIEDEAGTYGLFANYDDVLAALDAYENLSEDALEYLSEDAVAYYEYLLSIQPGLEEGMDVYEQIVAIEAMDLEDLDDATIEAIAAMYEDYLALSEDAQNLLDPEYVSWLVSLVLDTVEGNVEDLPGTVEDFDAAFNDAETKEQTVNDLLNAWRQYQAMSDELKDEMDQDYRAHLEALYARYLELTRPQVDLAMIGLILVHLSAGAYFAFKKRDILVKTVNN
jgi:alpha-tubulin suppressor-like RCC1 family protein